MITSDLTDEYGFNDIDGDFYTFPLFLSIRYTSVVSRTFASECSFTKDYFEIFSMGTYGCAHSSIYQSTRVARNGSDVESVTVKIRQNEMRSIRNGRIVTVCLLGRPI